MTDRKVLIVGGQLSFDLGVALSGVSELLAENANDIASFRATCMSIAEAP